MGDPRGSVENAPLQGFEANLHNLGRGSVSFSSPLHPSFSSRKLESREIGIRGFQTTSSRKRRKRQDGFLEIFDNKNFIQDLFSKKVNSCRLNETIIFERLMIQEKITSDCYLLQIFHFQVSNCFKFSPERKRGWIFEIGNPRYKNFIQIIYLDLFSDY